MIGCHRTEQYIASLLTFYEKIAKFSKKRGFFSVILFYELNSNMHKPQKSSHIRDAYLNLY